MTGKLAPETAKPVPATVTELTVTATVPVDVSVTAFEAVEFKTTFPNDKLLVLILRVDVAALSCTAKLCELLPTVAVNVAACVVLTEPTDAVKVVLLAPVGTFTEAGTETDKLLLASPTFTPPLGAAPLRVTLQASLPDPVNDELLHDRTLNPGMVTVPMPLRLITVTGLLDELLTMLSWPVAAPAVVGSNCTASVTTWLGFKVSGKLPPNTENPAPATVAALTVTAAVPLEVRVTDIETAAFKTTLPNDKRLVLTLNPGIAAFNCRLKVCQTLPAVAVNVAACALLTNATAAVKSVLSAPAGTFTEAGKETERVLLDKFTSVPALGATPLSITVQISLPDPIIDELLQVRALSETPPTPGREPPFP